MPDNVRLPRLLDGELREARRLKPTALSLTLNRRGISEAELTLAREDEPLPLLAFAELYLRRGSAGVYRVVEAKRAALGDNSRTYTLRHAIDTLRDSVWREQEDFSGTVTAFLTKLLSFQTVARWQLGTVSDTGQWKKSGINYDHLDKLLWELAEDRQDYLFAFDFSTAPWTLSFVAASGTVDCEMREKRNLYDGQARETREGMCNRLYLTVHATQQNAEAATVTEPTVTLTTHEDAASQALYGVIEGTADIDAADVPDTAAWVAAYFGDHAVPLCQTSADGWEIVKTTGEPFDQLDLGKKCRVPALNAEGPVESIRFGDLLNDSDKARVDLNRKLPRFSENLRSLKEEAREAAASARSAGYAAKKNEAKIDVDHIRFEHKTQVTQEGMEDCFGIIGVKLDPTTHAPLKDENGDYIWAGPNDQPAEIWGHLHRNAWETLIQNNIKDSNGKILSLASVYTDAYGNAIITAINDQRTGQATIRGDRILVGTTSGSYLGIDSDGRIVLTANNAVAAINAATVKINAEQIQLGTYGGSAITLDERISLDTDGYILLKATTIVQGPLDVQGNYSVSARNFVVGTGGYIRLIGAQTGEYYDLTAANMPGCIRDLQFIVDPNNAGHIILQKKTIYNSATWTDAANFNIAATQFYQDGVAAAKSISTNSTISLSVSDLGQTTSHSITVSNGYDNTTKSLSVSVYAPIGGANSNQIDLANRGQIWLHSSDPGSDYVNLGALGERITEGKNNRSAYVTFQATCDGGATYKYYKIPL